MLFECNYGVFFMTVQFFSLNALQYSDFHFNICLQLIHFKYFFLKRVMIDLVKNLPIQFYSPRSDMITTTMSNMFQAFEKQYCLRATNFTTHSAVKIVTKSILILLRMLVFIALCSQVSTIIVIILRQMRIMMTTSKA